MTVGDGSIYPPTNNWMNEITAVGNAPINRKGKVFYEARDFSQPIQDEWENDLVYRMPGTRNPNSFDLYSVGEDGKSRSNGDDPDDVAHWHSRERIVAYYDRPLWQIPGFRRGATASALILLALAAIWTLRHRWVKSSASKNFT